MADAHRRELSNSNAPKKATNLSINSDLLRQARELGLNLSSVMEEALEQIIRRRRSQRWLEENRAAIDRYNDHVDEHGVFSDGIRSF